MMSLNNHTFGFYRGLIAFLIINGTAYRHLVVNGLSQEFTLGNGPVDGPASKWVFKMANGLLP
jgi:hypothetical protein